MGVGGVGYMYLAVFQKAVLDNPQYNKQTMDNPTHFTNSLSAPYCQRKE